MPTYLVCVGGLRSPRFLRSVSPVSWCASPEQAFQFHTEASVRLAAVALSGLPVIWKYSGAVVRLDNSSRP